VPRSAITITRRDHMEVGCQAHLTPARRARKVVKAGVWHFGAPIGRMPVWALDELEVLAEEVGAGDEVMAEVDS
jgi:hypothetical protein